MAFEVTGISAARGTAAHHVDGKCVFVSGRRVRVWCDAEEHAIVYVVEIRTVEVAGAVLEGERHHLCVPRHDSDGIRIREY